MDYMSAVKAGFNNELTEIVRTSHEKLAGFLRSGRRPFKASTLLKKKADMVKMSETKSKLLRYGAPAVAGAIGYDQLKKAKQDWRMGREMRKQQGSQGY